MTFLQSTLVLCTLLVLVLIVTDKLLAEECSPPGLKHWQKRLELTEKLPDSKAKDLKIELIKKYIGELGR